MNPTRRLVFLFSKEFEITRNDPVNWKGKDILSQIAANGAGDQQCHWLVSKLSLSVEEMLLKNEDISGEGRHPASLSPRDQHCIQACYGPSLAYCLPHTHR